MPRESKLVTTTIKLVTVESMKALAAKWRKEAKAYARLAAAAPTEIGRDRMEFAGTAYTLCARELSAAIRAKRGAK